MNEPSSISSATRRVRALGRVVRVLGIAVILGVILGAAVPQSTAAATKPTQKAASKARKIDAVGASLSRLEWLAGCWECRAGTRLVEEQWMAPRGATMLGMSRTVRGDTLVEYEQLRIYERSGTLVYAARPSGQPPAEFVCSELGDSVIVFENPKHDFPQRIVYCRVGLDSLLARVEGTSRGKNRALSYPYVHIACPSGGPSPTR
jgi:hypothetical protein